MTACLQPKSTYCDNITCFATQIIGNIELDGNTYSVYFGTGSENIGRREVTAVPIDIETAKYEINKLLHHYDPQCYVVALDEVYGGEFYRLTYGHGCATYTQEIEADRFASWFEGDIPSPDLENAVKQAIEELNA